MSKESTWVETTLGNVASWGSGGTPSRRVPEYFKGDIPWIKTGELGDKYIHECEEYISEEAIKRSSAKVFKKGSVGIAMYGATIGKLSIFGIDASTNQACAVAEPKGTLDKEFLYYFLLSERRSLIKAGKGGAQPNISQGVLKAWPINVPPIEVQRNIVAKIEELFSELDKGIESLKTARAQLKTYRQAVLKHAFEGKLTEQWRKDNAGKLESPEQLLARIQQERQARYRQQLENWKLAVKVWEESGKHGKKPTKPKAFPAISTLSNKELDGLPLLPEGFVYTLLSNLGDLGRGKSKHRPRNDPRLFGGIYPFIQTGEVKAANRRIVSYTQTYSELGLEQSKLWPTGTLCITIAANIAETAFLSFDGCFPDSVVGFSAFDSILPEYVEFFIKAVQVKIEAYAPATAQKNINLATLENLVVPYCSIEEQKQIVDKLEMLFSVIDNDENEITMALNKFEVLRQSILKKLFLENFHKNMSSNSDNEYQPTV